MKRDSEDEAPLDADVTVTPEVGSEGGSPGDVEIARDQLGTGSEAEGTWRPADEEKTSIRRDETGRGRRSP